MHHSFRLMQVQPIETRNCLAGVEMDTESNSGGKTPVLQTAMALVISFAICKTAMYLTKLCRIQGGSLPVVTAIVVLLATVFPTPFGYLAPAGDTIALVLMQVTETSTLHFISFLRKYYGFLNDSKYSNSNFK